MAARTCMSAPGGDVDMAGGGDWCDLKAELDLWASEGRIASLWWRDDDAVDVTPALCRALELARGYGAAIHLSVIPAGLSPHLGAALEGEPRVRVLQHGYAHAKGELYAMRPHEQVLGELIAGRDILRDALEPWFLPVLVPPWNLVRAEYLPLVAEAGFRALSTEDPRAARFAVPGVEVVNIHFGPLCWEGENARFIGRDKALDEVIEHLVARRTDRADPDEPTGFSTHHLQSDEASWAYTERLLAETSAHPAARWIDLAEIVQRQP